ncbi:hypothetical protein [Methanoculleus sp. UBA303]|jgi:hypothetical protein|uniref:hypothetical protein n=1 Tax=Methanoculleus sp. UBA303 TaxID=1915497 RepID=UPI0025F450DB|nr:hypothetical protein [Methanoculleus sp. UBA303]
MSLSFDAEAEALFGVSAPDDDPVWYEELHAALDANLPGSGDLPGRYRAFVESFAVPSDRLDRVFAAAFAESHRRIAEHLLLPAGEGIEVGYVTGEPWEVCNRYLGSGASLIEVSTDRPVTIDRALLYACHEGYPGHHTMWAIREASGPGPGLDRALGRPARVAARDGRGRCRPPRHRDRLPPA